MDEIKVVKIWKTKKVFEERKKDRKKERKKEKEEVETCVRAHNALRTHFGDHKF